MILIISTEEDISTNEVIDWLLYYNIPFIRINDTTHINIKSVEINGSNVSWTLMLKNDFDDNIQSISSDQIKGYWYRRGEITSDNFLKTNTNYKIKNGKIVSKLQNYLCENENDIIHFLHTQFKKNKNIGDYYENFIVKIEHLTIAADCGLSVPATKIITSKVDLNTFLKKHIKIISKGVRNNSFGIMGEIGVGCLTQIIKEEEIENFSEIFGPSLIQEYIEKFIELRVFYLDGKCYCAAIFSQKDPKTVIDFRNYNNELPNRIIPYMLPEEIEIKIEKFMNTIKMKSGSIDIIISNKLEYFFLEVNPVGQFGFISRKCNYEIEEKIANYFNY